MTARDLAVVGIGLLLGLILALAVILAVRPHCPTEDSCVANYRHHSWHINEVTP